MAASNHNFVARVTQLDAKELDDVFDDTVKNQFLRATKYLKYKWLVVFDPEINAALRFVVWKYSVNAVKASVGQQLLQIQYGNSGTPITYNRSLRLAFVSIISGWLSDRLDFINARISTAVSSNYKLFSSVVKWLEISIKMASFVNFLAFLLRGRYPMLVERLVGIEHIPAAKLQIRQISFEYMTRELIWHAFSEFLMFLIPLINFNRLSLFLKRCFSSSKSPASASMVLRPTQLHFCAICQQMPILPYSIGCQNVFCYVCIAGAVCKEPQYECKECGYRLKDVTHLQPAINSVSAT